MNTRLHPRLVLTLVLLFAGITNAGAAGLSNWVDKELTPYVAGQLTEHPRFKGETVVFVALENGAPAPLSNALVLALRDRLANALIDKPGIRIGWQAGHEFTASDAAPIDCRRDQVHYYLGLEVQPLIDGEYRVTLRVLDAADRSWVSGTSRTWQGRLTRAQARAFKQTMPDEYFRGSREAPYSPAQTDLLATHLAHQLTCQLLRQVSGEYVIAAAGEASNTAEPVAGALALVRNNLAGQPALQITTDSTAANARLGGQAHPISGDLYQYWVTVTPTGADSGLPAVSASTYIRVPTTNTASIAGQAPITPAVPGTQATATATPARLPTLPSSAAGAGLIAPLSVVEPRKRRACYRRGSKPAKQKLVSADHSVLRGECFLLQTRAARDASVFLINYQVIHGLVNLSGQRCGQQPWIAARAGQALQFPAASDVRPSASAWQGHAGLESFYAIAVSDSNAAEQLSRHIAQLPTRCTLSATQGLTGPALQTWLDGLSAITQRWQHALDWQAVRIEHRY